MNPPSPFFTATMARLYAEQGYLRKAAQVYRHLLELEPHREDLSRCLQTVEEQIAFLEDFFSRRSEVTFLELMTILGEKIRIVVTFLALLELIRAKQIIVRQHDPFGELSIMRKVA